MPLWPIVVSLGEVAQPQALPIACRLNANILRDSNAKERVHTVAQGERFGRGSFGSDRSEAAPFTLAEHCFQEQRALRKLLTPRQVSWRASRSRDVFISCPELPACGLQTLPSIGRQRYRMLIPTHNAYYGTD